MDFILAIDSFYWHAFYSPLQETDIYLIFVEILRLGPIRRWCSVGNRPFFSLEPLRVLSAARLYIVANFRLSILCERCLHQCFWAGRTLRLLRLCPLGIVNFICQVRRGGLANASRLERYPLWCLCSVFKTCRCRWNVQQATFFGMCLLRIIMLRPFALFLTVINLALRRMSSWFAYAADQGPLPWRDLCFALLRAWVYTALWNVLSTGSYHRPTGCWQSSHRLVTSHWMKRIWVRWLVLLFLLQIWCSSLRWVSRYYTWWWRARRMLPFWRLHCQF